MEMAGDLKLVFHWMLQVLNFLSRSGKDIETTTGVCEVLGVFQLPRMVHTSDRGATKEGLTKLARKT